MSPDTPLLGRRPQTSLFVFPQDVLTFAPLGQSHVYVSVFWMTSFWKHPDFTSNVRAEHVEIFSDTTSLQYIVWCWVLSTPGLLRHPLQALQQSSKTLRNFIFHVHQHMNNACVWWRFPKLWQISKISESRELCIFFDPLCRLTMLLFF